jgi:CDP-diacylglycerol--glycerol-3-phosphate 3-phosphatidyltransferase
MSWPHILSLSRVAISIPVAALALSGNGNALLLAALLFAAASLTDLLDGPMARRGRTVGPLGVYLDTTADKVLVIVDAWMAIVIVGREFLVSGVRTLAAVQGFVISANFAGKIKTTVTLIAIVLLLLVASAQHGSVLSHVGHLSAWRSIAWFAMLVGVILTIFSGAKYIVDAQPLFFPDRRAAGRAISDPQPAKVDRSSRP